MINVEHHDDVFLVRMDDGENRFSPEMLDAWDQALTQIERTDGPRALVTTGTGKFFSNGLDLDYLGANPDNMLSYIGRVHRLFARVLTLPCPTVAACNGHTFAAGAMLSICHDQRVMRNDRGYWCLPEVDLGMPFTPAMNALIPARIPATTALEAMVTGRRYDAAEAVQAGIVTEQAGETDVVPRSLALAQEQAAKAGTNLAGIRTQLHQSVLQLLQQEEAA